VTYVILYHNYSFFQFLCFYAVYYILRKLSYGATLRMSIPIHFFVSLPQVCEIALPSCVFLGWCCESFCGGKPEEKWKSFCGGLNVWSWSGCYYDWKFVCYLWTWKGMFKAFYFNHFWHNLNSLTHNANSMEQTPLEKLIVIQLMQLPTKVNYCVHRTLPLVPLLNQMNPVYTLPSSFSKIYFNIILPGMP